MKNYWLKIFKQFAKLKRKYKLCYKNYEKWSQKTSTSTFSSKYWLIFFLFSYLLNHKILYDSFFFISLSLSFIFSVSQLDYYYYLFFYLLNKWFQWYESNEPDFFAQLKQRTKKSTRKEKKNNTKTVFTFFQKLLGFFVLLAFNIDVVFFSYLVILLLFWETNIFVRDWLVWQSADDLKKSKLVEKLRGTETNFLSKDDVHEFKTKRET